MTVEQPPKQEDRFVIVAEVEDPVLLSRLLAALEDAYPGQFVFKTRPDPFGEERTEVLLIRYSYHTTHEVLMPVEFARGFLAANL
jgi:hypothetical protein